LTCGWNRGTKVPPGGKRGATGHRKRERPAPRGRKPDSSRRPTAPRTAAAGPVPFRGAGVEVGEQLGDGAAVPGDGAAAGECGDVSGRGVAGVAEDEHDYGPIPATTKCSDRQRSTGAELPTARRAVPDVPAA